MNFAQDIEQIPSVVDYSERLTVEADIVSGRQIYNPTISIVCDAITFRGNMVAPSLRLEDIQFASVPPTELSFHSRITDALTFQLLADRWKRETGHFSVVQQKVIHPTYQEIIGMGERALPLLINEIQRTPSHWFWALRAIARENPARDSATVEEATRAWTDWWNKKQRVSTRRYATMDFSR